ncbi:MAG: leucyl aminopeptidase [Peptococcaceae bacterium]|jgi:leucyl aminopeptidase|nr:leucyl aminopeptidase [Peptococcaceae bacterium]
MSVVYSFEIESPFDTLIVDVREDGTVSAKCPDIQKIFASLNENEKENQSFGTRVFGITFNGQSYDKIVFVRRSDKLTPRKVRQRYGAAAKLTGNLHGENAVYIPDETTPKEWFTTITEGFLLGQYKFGKYAKKPPKAPAKIVIAFAENIRAEIEEGNWLAEAAYLARDLSFEPANVATPEEIARQAESIAEIPGVKAEVFGKNEIQALRLGAFLAVSRGSAREPKLITIDYDGAPQSAERLALIGKGICFDSGGYCIKQYEGITSMKSDMEGAAVVLGAVSAIAKAKLKFNITVIVAACENLISGEAVLPGDIIESRSGTQIEIVNTDAEGRLTLADALTYAIEEKKATRLLDIATLTGACAMALGSQYIGTFSSDEDFYKLIEESSRLSGEDIWRLPLSEEYKILNRSEVAHIKNVGERAAGAISAALFLQEFTGGLPWIHLDIAGASRSGKDKEIFAVGPTGAGTALLYNLVKNLAEEGTSK